LDGPVGFRPISGYDLLGEEKAAVRPTQQFSITLPLDMAEAVEEKIRSGGYASVSEVVRDGVRALLERDAAVERWLREEVLDGHAEFLADPSKGVLADDIMGRIGGRYAGTNHSKSFQYAQALSLNSSTSSG
jgi:putative addiction module CopG family antidote